MRILGLLSLAVLLCWSQEPVNPIDQSEQRITGPLTRAGIDLRDEAALIRVLQQRATQAEVNLAACAAYALGKLPKTDIILRELNLAALADDENLMNYAIRSLLKFGDRQWVPAAAARLPSVRDRVSQVRLAGELARAGRHDGWDVIADTIVEGGGLLYEALFQVASFEGMKDASGKPVDLMVKLDELGQRAPETARGPILQTINQIGLERMRAAGQPIPPRSVAKPRQ